MREKETDGRRDLSAKRNLERLEGRSAHAVSVTLVQGPVGIKIVSVATTLVA